MKNRHLTIYHNNIEQWFESTSDSAEKIRFKFLNKKYDVFYYKANSKHSFAKNEIIGQLILKHLGMKHVSMYPCTYVAKSGKCFEGVLSRDYINNRDNVEVFNFEYLLNRFYIPSDQANLHTTISSFYKMANKYKDGGKKEVLFEKDFSNNLKKLILFFYLTGQADLKPGNIEFKVTKQSNTALIEILPYIDNSISFFRRVSRTPDIEKVFEDPDMYLGHDCLPFVLHSSILVTEDLAHMIQTEPDIEKFYQKACSLDLEKMINNYNKEGDEFRIDKTTKALAVTYYNTSIKNLKECIARLSAKKYNSLKKQYSAYEKIRDEGQRY